MREPSDFPPFPFRNGNLDAFVYVVPAGGKYGQWVCTCEQVALWNLEIGSGWCDHCGLSLITTYSYRQAFGAAPGGAVLVRAHVDSLPHWVNELTEGGTDE